MNLTHKSYSFYSHNLNIIKYNELFEKAKQLLEFKNSISNEVCDNFNHFINLSKFDWINHFRTRLPNCNNQDISYAISDVYVAYDNKRNKLIQNTTIKIQDKFKISYYKKNVGKNKVGDIKSYELSNKSTNLTKVTTYLSRYYNDGLIEFLKTNKVDDKQAFRDLVLKYINKFGDRLINLAISRQKRINSRLTENPIEFESYSYTSCTEQKQNIITKNKNKNNESNAYITLSGQKINGGKIVIPIKYSNKHHGSIKHYFKNPSKNNIIKFSYTIVFDEKKKRIRVILCRLKHDDIVKHKKEYYGLDINVKHNLFADKYGNQVDYDRKQLLDYVQFLKRCDEKLKIKRINNEKPVLNKKDRINKERLTKNIKDMVKRKSNEMVKKAISLGKDHIVLEDLNVSSKLFATNEEFEGFKYSRLVRILSLSDIKNIITSIANKKGLQVTFIQPHYTSQTCTCGCVDKANRPKQEIFKCVSCGETHNADTHAASMIEDRLRVDVLRKSLLNFDKGLYTPKKLNKSTIKNILETCYDNNKH